MYYQTVIYSLAGYVADGTTQLAAKQLNCPFPVSRMTIRCGYSMRCTADGAFYVSQTNLVPGGNTLFSISRIADNTAGDVIYCKDLNDEGVTFNFQDPVNLTTGIEIYLKSTTLATITTGVLILQFECSRSA